MRSQAARCAGFAAAFSFATREFPPAAGVGNDRAELSEAYLGCPVIAVGVPTVADAAALSDSADAQSLFVTPRNIDELVRSASKLIAYGIDLALHRGLGIEDIDALIE